MSERLVPWERLLLPDITLVDEIESHIRAFEERCGRKAVRVSTWNPSEETKRALLRAMPAPPLNDEWIDYSYSYVLKRTRNNWKRVLGKLGFEHADVAAQVMENGTAALAAVANALGLRNVRKVFVLGPCYFAVPVALRRFGIHVEHVVLPRAGNTYSFPSDFYPTADDVLWITHPIYSTGVHSLEQSIGHLTRLADDGVLIVADEVLALPPSRIAAALGGHRNFIGIYAPHKAVSLNRVKFSLVAFHPAVGDIFDHWADALHGGLSLSASFAVDHFVSDHYDGYRKHFVDRLDEVREWHETVVHEFRQCLQTDRDVRGYFISVYFPHIKACLGNDTSFHKMLIEETGCAVIPGSRGCFDEAEGFSFRLNLAADSGEFRDAVLRLYRFLAVLSRRGEAHRQRVSTEPQTLAPRV